MTQQPTPEDLSPGAFAIEEWKAKAHEFVKAVLLIQFPDLALDADELEALETGVDLAALYMVQSAVEAGAEPEMAQYLRKVTT